MIDRKIVGKESKTVRKFRKLRKFLNLVLCLIILPILFVNIIMVVKSIVKPKEIPSFLGYKFFVILSGSMQDTLNIGDFIIVKETDEIHKNDIISYYLDDTVITHRVIEINNFNGETTYITQGDNNKTAIDEEPVALEQIEGKYIFKMPYIGNFLKFLQTTPGVIILILLPIIILIINFKLNEYSDKQKVIRKSKRIIYNEDRK